MTILTELGVHSTSQTTANLHLASSIVGADCLSQSHEVTSHGQKQRYGEDEFGGDRARKGRATSLTRPNEGDIELQV